MSARNTPFAARENTVHNGQNPQIDSTNDANQVADTAQPAKSRRDKPLSAKQLQFIDEYLIDRNGTKAYQRVCPGVSDAAAAVSASKLLRIAKVKAIIAEKCAETSEKLVLTREMCIAQYQRLAFSDPRKLFDAYGRIKPVHELDDDSAAALQGMDLDYQRNEAGEFTPVLKIKMADRKGALDSIMKAQGWNSAEKHEVTGKGGKPIEHAVRVVLVPPKQRADVSVKTIESGD